MENKTLFTVMMGLLVLAGLFAVQQVRPSAPISVELSQNLSQDEMIEILDAECTDKMAAECAVEVEQTVRACAKAFETEGADIVADIKCAKDLLADKKLCWPCICYEAQKRGWHVIGC